MVGLSFQAFQSSTAVTHFQGPKRMNTVSLPRSGRPPTEGNDSTSLRVRRAHTSQATATPTRAGACPAPLHVQAYRHIRKQSHTRQVTSRVHTVPHTYIRHTDHMPDTPGRQLRHRPDPYNTGHGPDLCCNKQALPTSAMRLRN